MNLGDKVKFEDPLGETLYGVIKDKIVPRCKCKGKGEFMIDFNGVTKRIKIGDNRLTLNN